jgi:hypothetical protein
MDKNMSHYLRYLITLFLSLSMTSYGSAFTLNQESVQSDNAKLQTQPAKRKPHVNTGLSVINIVIDTITNNVVYSKDGRSFPITDSTNIINNHNPRVKVQLGELIFQNGNLVTIIIK